MELLSKGVSASLADIIEGDEFNDKTVATKLMIVVLHSFEIHEPQVEDFVGFVRNSATSQIQ